MNKIFPILVGLAAGLMFLAGASSSGSAAPKCVWASDMSRALCAPPFGDIVRDRNREIYYCAPGQCIVNTSGEFRCSSVPGGAAAIDSRNRAACVGGCEAPSEDLCVRPVP